MKVSIIVDGHAMDLSEAQFRAVSGALLDAQRAACGRSMHARREGRAKQAAEHLTHLARLERVIDFLLARSDHHEGGEQ